VARRKKGHLRRSRAKEEKKGKDLFSSMTGEKRIPEGGAGSTLGMKRERGGDGLI